MHTNFSKALRCCCIGAVLLAAIGCGRQETPLMGGFEEAFRFQLETAEPGAVIEVPKGRFVFQRRLSLNADGVTIRGVGAQDSILSFQGQIAGAEGLYVAANDFTIVDLAIEDTAGDALKIQGGSNILVRRVRTEWTRGPHRDNGAYGIYPVQTENILIEESVAIGASDAGIYVGQSRNVIVRNNRVEFNVAGIEIENTVAADVYGNAATNNTGGILVFNMPDLAQQGHSIRVFNNRVWGNNTANFGAPGSAVAGVPAGSGVLINAHDAVELFGNEIADHRTANVLISSYFSAAYSGERDVVENFDPYPETILIFGNTFSGGGDAPDYEGLNAVRRSLYGTEGRLPDMVWDGFRHPERNGREFAICVNNGWAELLDIDAGNNYVRPVVAMRRHACSHPRLAPVVLPDS